jgi:hypothetical protein
METDKVMKDDWVAGARRLRSFYHTPHGGMEKPLRQIGPDPSPSADDTEAEGAASTGHCSDQGWVSAGQPEMIVGGA